MKLFWNIALVLLFGATTLGCSALLYYPSKVRFTNPDRLPIKPEEIRLKGKDGLEVVAWYFRPPAKVASRGRILFFHGNGENLSTHFMTLYWVVEKGYELIIFDYPGYGASGGDPSPKNTVASGLRVLDWISTLEPRLPLAFYGQSLGGAVALRTAFELKGRQHLCLIAVDSTFSSYRAVAKDFLKRQWATWWIQPLVPWLINDEWAPKGKISQLSPVPLIVIHGEKDRTIEFERGQQVFQEAHEPKEFWSVPNGDHMATAFVGSSREKFRGLFVERLDSLCPKSGVAKL